MRYLVGLVIVVALAGCGGINTSRINGSFPKTGSIVPAVDLNVSPSLAIPLEKLVFWGAYAGAAYLILDPLAPNWEIEEAKFPDERYMLSLHMKRIYVGGAGEARAIFHRRAGELTRAGEYSGYQVIEYTERLESSVLGSQRVVTGVIQLTKKD